MFGPHRHRVLPRLGRWLARDRHDDARPSREPAVRTCPGRRRVEQDERSDRPAPAGLGGVQCADDLAPGRRGRPEHGVEDVHIGHHHQPAPTAPRSRRVLRLLALPSSAHLGLPLAVRPAPGRTSSLGPRGTLRTDELVRCGWRRSDVDNSGYPTKRRADASVRCGRMEWCPARLTGVARTSRNRWHRQPMRRRRPRREERSAHGERTGRPPSGGIDGGRRRFSSGGLS